jgi:anti-sigma B factor antagonist
MAVQHTSVRTTRVADGWYVVAVAGDLDVDVEPTLRRSLHDLAEGGATTIIVDLLEASFIDSAGLSALVGAAEALEATGGGLVVVSDSPDARKLLSGAAIGDSFRLETSLVRAVTHAVDGRE